MVANYMAEGWDLPEPSPARGRSFVRLASLVAAKAEVYRAMRQTGIDKAELARPGAVPAWRRCGGGGQRRTDPVLVQRGIASLPVRHCVQARQRSRRRTHPSRLRSRFGVWQNPK
jgi:hypothetical protein